MYGNFDDTLLFNFFRLTDLRTKLYDKRDDFDFPIVNFLFMSINIPAAPAYGVDNSQLIRYSSTCASYQDFIGRGLQLIRNYGAKGFSGKD